jgi:hypothetical protein
MTDHLPIQHIWLCSTCKEDWPCPTAREDLLAEFADAAVPLALYLASCFTECSGDLADAHSGELYRRFFGWLRIRQPPTRRL